MNKKVMALAVAGALGAPAAALAQVQIGGSVHLQYFQHDSDRDAFEKTDVLTTSEPEIYIRSEEKLGGGNSVWLQCTSSFDFLGVAASNTTGAGQWCGRNSALGFRGGWGNLFFGTWDTPHKLVSNQARGWWGGTNTLQGGSLQVLANGSDSNVPNTGSSFFRRHQRSVNYHSPDWGGFNLMAAFSSANEATAATTGANVSPRMYSLAGTFRTGPFFAGLGYEQHSDFALTAGSDTSFNVSAGVTFGGARISLLYLAAEYKPDVGSKVEHDGLALYVDWTISGPHSLYAQYVQRGDTKVAGATVSNSGVQVMGVHYGYRLSKRTQIYGGFNQMSNDDSASFTFGTSATTVGGTQTVVGVGLRHSF